MRILIVEGAGGVGARLCRILKKDQHEIIVIHHTPEALVGRLPAEVSILGWEGESGAVWSDLIDQDTAIVNLAGWPSTGESQGDDATYPLRTARAVAEVILRAPELPRLLLQTSSVAYYGDGGDDLIVEESPPGESRAARAVAAWEQTSADLPVRRCWLRLGRMLDESPLSLPQSPAADRAWVSWVHGDDAARAIRFLLTCEAASGPVNLVAPNPVVAAAFNRALAGVHAAPISVYEVPVMLESQRVLPQKLLSWGFRFVYADFEDALRCLSI